MDYRSSNGRAVSPMDFVIGLADESIVSTELEKVAVQQNVSTFILGSCYTRLFADVPYWGNDGCSYVYLACYQLFAFLAKDAASGIACVILYGLSSMGLTCYRDCIRHIAACRCPFRHFCRFIQRAYERLCAPYTCS